MSVLSNNLDWIIVNVALALLGNLTCYLTIKTPEKPFKLIFFVLWVLFIPNTIYLLTDLQYLPDQFWLADSQTKLFLLIQYIGVIIIGITTYLYALYPMERHLNKLFKISRQNLNLLIIFFNFLIALGVTLGKVQRTQSWYALFNPLRVISDIEKSLTSPTLLLLIFTFGILTNLIYFFFKKYLKPHLG